VVAALPRRARDFNSQPFIAGAQASPLCQAAVQHGFDLDALRLGGANAQALRPLRGVVVHLHTMGLQQGLQG